MQLNHINGCHYLGKGIIIAGLQIAFFSTSQSGEPNTKTALSLLGQFAKTNCFALPKHIFTIKVAVHAPSCVFYIRIFE